MGWIGPIVASLILGAFVGITGGLILHWEGQAMLRGGYGWVWGLCVGVVASVLGAVPALRRYRSLVELVRIRLRNTTPLTDSNSSGTAGLTIDMEQVAEDIERLSSRLDRYQEYVQRAKSLTEGKEFGASIDDEMLDRLREHLTSLNERMTNLGNLQQDFNRDVRPIFENRLDPIRLEGVVDFQGLIGFQTELEDHLGDVDESLASLDGTLEKLDSMPDRIRDQIEQANRLLLELAEVFRHFPAEDLVESAEELRQETLDWDGLADHVKERMEELRKAVESSRTTLDNVRNRAGKKPGAEETWEQVKKELANVDEKVREIQRATDPEWMQRLDDELELIRSRAGSIAGSIRDLVEDIESRRQRRRRHHELIRDLAEGNMP